MRAILLADQVRFAARESDSERIAREIAGSDSRARFSDEPMETPPAMVRGAGVVTPPRSYVGTVREDRRTPRTRCSEPFADSDGNVIYVPGAVKVTHADGSVTFARQSDYRRRSTSRRRSQTRTVAVQVETAQVALDSQTREAIADGTA